MKLRIVLLALLMLASPWAQADEPPVFYKAVGEYHLPDKMTLTIASEKGELAYTLKTGLTEGRTFIGGGMSHAKVGEPFLIFWEASNQTLWWATRPQIGYLHISGTNSSSSATFADPARVDRPIPKAFLSEVEHTLRTKP